MATLGAVVDVLHAAEGAGAHRGGLLARELPLHHLRAVLGEQAQHVAKGRRIGLLPEDGQQPGVQLRQVGQVVVGLAHGVAGQ